ncbi:hypothetical protein SASPL_101642 [Salvia splendens]|uniref:Uncharacterized protein n=1 Tax=Salvia splendens TaxID=180675 RepID=A0A8X8YPR8_SALSN|nr:hypothetical protein SASPL_101642 [Salvia splendens]
MAFSYLLRIFSECRSSKQTLIAMCSEKSDGNLVSGSNHVSAEKKDQKLTLFEDLFQDSDTVNSNSDVFNDNSSPSDCESGVSSGKNKIGNGEPECSPQVFQVNGNVKQPAANFPPPPTFSRAAGKHKSNSLALAPLRSAADQVKPLKWAVRVAEQQLPPKSDILLKSQSPVSAAIQKQQRHKFYEFWRLEASFNSVAEPIRIDMQCEVGLLMRTQSKSDEYRRNLCRGSGQLGPEDRLTTSAASGSGGGGEAPITQRRR